MVTNTNWQLDWGVQFVVDGCLASLWLEITDNDAKLTEILHQTLEACFQTIQSGRSHFRFKFVDQNLPTKTKTHRT